jgi:hypothetical protein
VRRKPEILRIWRRLVRRFPRHILQRRVLIGAAAAAVLLLVAAAALEPLEAALDPGEETPAPNLGDAPQITLRSKQIPTPPDSTPPSPAEADAAQTEPTSTPAPEETPADPPASAETQPPEMVEELENPRRMEFQRSTEGRPLMDCGWVVTFQDNFEGYSLDLSRWDTGYKAGDHEAQYYVDDVFTVEDGILRIRAEERQVRDRTYASGIITTEGIFAQQYGHFEARVRIPAGQGLWPAFWLLPATPNYPVEIDVFEILGHTPDRAYMTNHWRDPDVRHNSHTYGYRGPDFSENFHTFGMTWTEDEIVWFIDGVERAREDRGIPQEPLFLLLNLAVGGKWPGYPDDTTPFPSDFEIDYVRVYKWSCPGEDTWQWRDE